MNHDESSHDSSPSSRLRHDDDGCWSPPYYIITALLNMEEVRLQHGHAQASLPPLHGVDAGSLRLLQRYISQLRTDSARDDRPPLSRLRIRMSNPAFRRMDERAVAVLTSAAVGYAPALDESGDSILRLTHWPSDHLLASTAAALHAELGARVSLESLSTDVLARILRCLRAPELCAAVAASRALARCAHDACLFALFCEPARVRRICALLCAPADDAAGEHAMPRRGATLRAKAEPALVSSAPAGAAGAAEAAAALVNRSAGHARTAWHLHVGVDWRRLMLAECLWRRARARASVALRASLREGADPARVLAATKALRLPRDVAASLLVADGQEPAGAAAGSFVGGNLRLLSLREIEAELAGARDVPSGARDAVPLTDCAGPLQLLVRAEDGGEDAGSVWLAAGFGRARKAASWLALLDRLETEVA